MWQNIKRCTCMGKTNATLLPRPCHNTAASKASANWVNNKLVDLVDDLTKCFQPSPAIHCIAENALTGKFFLTKVFQFVVRRSSMHFLIRHQSDVTVLRFQCFEIFLMWWSMHNCNIKFYTEVRIHKCVETCSRYTNTYERWHLQFRQL